MADPNVREKIIHTHRLSYQDPIRPRHHNLLPFAGILAQEPVFLRTTPAQPCRSPNNVENLSDSHMTSTSWSMHAPVSMIQGEKTLTDVRFQLHPTTGVLSCGIFEMI